MPAVLNNPVPISGDSSVVTEWGLYTVENFPVKKYIELILDSHDRFYRHYALPPTEIWWPRETLYPVMAESQKLMSTLFGREPDGTMFFYGMRVNPWEQPYFKVTTSKRNETLMWSEKFGFQRNVLIDEQEGSSSGRYPYREYKWLMPEPDFSKMPPPPPPLLTEAGTRMVRRRIGL